jgi:hypothetical protein
MRTAGILLEIGAELVRDMLVIAARRRMGLDRLEQRIAAMELRARRGDL